MCHSCGCHVRCVLCWSLIRSCDSPLPVSPQGYRYFGGVGVPQSCESALTHYRLVANYGKARSCLSTLPLWWANEQANSQYLIPGSMRIQHYLTLSSLLQMTAASNAFWLESPFMFPSHWLYFRVFNPECITDSCQVMSNLPKILQWLANLRMPCGVILG